GAKKDPSDATLKAMGAVQIPYGQPGPLPTAKRRWPGAKTILPGFDRGEVTLIGGKTGAFKSVFLVQTCVAIAYGRPDIVGFAPADLMRRGDCIVFANEDSQGASGLRMEAILGLPQADETLPRFAFETWGEQVFARDPRTKAVSWRRAALDRLHAYRSQGRDIALIGLDTLSATTEGGLEETNTEFQMIANMARGLGQL